MTNIIKGPNGFNKVRYIKRGDQVTTLRSTSMADYHLLRKQLRQDTKLSMHAQSKCVQAIDMRQSKPIIQ